MKRRGFLTIIGGAVTAPFLPAVAAAPAGGAFQVAVAHAQKYPVISVSGLSKRGNLSVAQAEQMIQRLAREGMVKLVGPSRNGSVRAASKIMINDPWGLARTSQPRPQVQTNKPRQSANAAQGRSTAGDIPPWLAHLHDLCRTQGMALHPRCFAA